MTRNEEKQLKEKTHTLLMDNFSSNGKGYAIKVAQELLYAHDKGDDPRFKQIVNGELCETVLEICVIDFVMNHEWAHDWVWDKGLVLRNKDGQFNSRFLTELDFTLFTEDTVFLFECKSYSGDKTLTDLCTLTKTSTYRDASGEMQKNTRTFDVFNQSSIHAQTLMRWMEPFTLRGATPKVQLVLFDFSRGGVKDLRTQSHKLLMPCVNETTVQNLFNKGQPRWSLSHVANAVNSLHRTSEFMEDAHYQYVTGLHKK